MPFRWERRGRSSLLLVMPLREKGRREDLSRPRYARKGEKGEEGTCLGLVISGKGREGGEGPV